MTYFAVGVSPGWSYGVVEGDILYFDDEGSYTNGAEYPVKDLTIYNITRLTTEPMDWMGENQIMDAVYYQYLFY